MPLNDVGSVFMKENYIKKAWETINSKLAFISNSFHSILQPFIILQVLPHLSFNMSMPRGFTVSGIGRLGISMENPRGPVPAVPVQENSLEFTGVSLPCPNLNLESH